MGERSLRRRQAVMRILRSARTVDRPRIRHVAPIVEDGSRRNLAFVSFRDGVRSIWIMRVDAGDSSAVSLLPGLGRTFDPAWSPDGSTLVFISDVDGHENVHSLDIESGTVTRLTSNRADHRYPAMSPDGSTIVYLRARWPRPPQIWMMGIDGDNACQWHAGPGYKVRPSFRPDGMVITAQLDRPHPGIHAFVVANGPNGPHTDLSRTRDQDTYPSWSPDGTRLAYAKTERRSLDAGVTSKQIWIMDADGSNPRPLVTFADARHPAWSADGEWVAFDADTPDGRRIHVVRPDGSDLRRVTDLGDDHTPAWRPTERHSTPQ